MRRAGCRYLLFPKYKCLNFISLSGNSNSHYSLAMIPVVIVQSFNNNKLDFKMIISPVLPLLPLLPTDCM